MNERSAKRTFDEGASNSNELTESSPTNKYLKTSSSIIEISTIQHLCSDILLQIFQYLRPIDLLYSFTNLYPYLTSLIEPYTHTIDFRFINKSYFQYLTQSLLPNLTTNLRILRLSNTYTFNQISELIYHFDWSQINQLESLTFDSIEYVELSKYVLDIHPILQQLWRLSLTFDENNRFVEQLLIDHILIPTNSLLKNCFIIGITFDLTKLILPKPNQHLRELTITLSTLKDLIILFQIVPNLEILTCTIASSTSNESLPKTPSLNSLTTLILTIKQSLLFKTLQEILTPHINIKQLSLNITLRDEDTSQNPNQEIGGLLLEKFFRVYSNLTELHFYIRHIQNSSIYITPDDLYLYSFTSHFWLKHSIEVCTHFIQGSKQRYIYTLPFHFDTFHIIENINEFFSSNFSYYYENVQHLSLSTTSTLDELCYSSKILKFFPKIKTITLEGKLSSTATAITLNNHHWILQRSGIDRSSRDTYPDVYILNNRKSKHWYFQKLDFTTNDQQFLSNNSKFVRQLTVYEMTKEQAINLCYFFPWINVLILHVDTLDWISLCKDWLHRILTNLPSLFSLTIYYPKYLNHPRHGLIAETLLTVKKHFFIKCDHGILNIWF